MYSVIETSGFQQKVTLGETLKVPRLEVEKGQNHVYSNVLLYSSEGESTVGTPHIAEASVTVEVLTHGQGDKIKVFKRKRRKRYRKTQGHRQDYSEVIVTQIANGSETHSAEEVLVSRARARVTALEKQKIHTEAKTSQTESGDK